MPRRPLVLALCCLAACQPAPESPEAAAAREQAAADSARAAIAENNARFVRYSNAGQADSMGTLFAPDGVMMPPDMPMSVGRDSIVARLATMTVPGGVLTLTSQNLSVSGDMALARGTWTYVAPAQGGNPAVDLKGKYLEHWHRIGGQWLMVEDIWNNDAPAPPPPPAAPPRRG